MNPTNWKDLADLQQEITKSDAFGEKDLPDSFSCFALGYAVY